MKELVKRIKFIRALFIVFVVALSLSSCQKEITGDIAPITDTVSLSSLVKTYTEDVTTSLGHQAETFILSYDSRDRVTSLTASAIPGNKLIYQYADSSYTLDIYVDNVLSIHEVFFINSLSLVDSTIQSNDTNDTTTEKYIYNSAKQLITKKEYEYSSIFGTFLSNTHNYTYDNFGNVLNDSDDATNTTYTYYPDLINNLNIGQIYFIRNTNLTKTTTSNSGGISTTLEHTYTFDNLNRLSSEKMTSASGDVVIRTYTY